MTTIINGSSPSITFSDSTTQSTAFNGQALSATPFTTSLGSGALVSNTSGINNTAVGYQAGYTTTTAANSVCVGYKAGFAQTTVGSNVYVGESAGLAATGGNNTFLGNGSGYLITSGGKNSILGSYNGNQGSLDIRTASNYIVLSDGDGNPRMWMNTAGDVIFSKTNPYLTSLNSSLYAFGRDTSSSGVYLAHNATSWASTSDERRKDIIEPITDAVNKISTLRTVIGKFKVDEEGVRRPFLIAQDVQAIFPEAVNAQEDEDGEFLGMSYTDVVPLLVAAIKELKTELDATKAEVAALKAKP